MLGERLDTYRPSLRRWSRALATAWLIGAGLMVPVSITILDEISEDAQSTYTKEIPSLLDQNRKAIKLERLSSFIRAFSSTHDPRTERRVFLQLQALAQHFDLDDDAKVIKGAAQAVAGARRILVLRDRLMRMEASPPAATDAVDVAAQRLDLERSSELLCDETVRELNSLTDYLTTDAALAADRTASRILRNASHIKYGCLAVLSLLIAAGAICLWVFQRHVLTPIAVAVQGLEAISEAGSAVVALPRSRFFELDMIGRSVEQYARFAGDLRAANLTLRALSKQDGLTGLANRRGFDADLAETCRWAATSSGSFALMLIDIDHFKLLNDRFGHLVGDQCLRHVARILQEFCAWHGCRASRYGGEEFAMLVSDVSVQDAYALAEQLRTAVERAQVSAGGVTCAVTASIGVARIAAGAGVRPEAVIEAADGALYRAKREGRNRIRLSGPEGPSAAPSQSAA